MRRRGGGRLVLDTGVLMLVLKGDGRAAGIVRLVEEGAEAYTASTNLAELYYKALEKLGRDVALSWAYRLMNLRDLVITPVDARLALHAGELKAKYRGLLSLADSIAAALAERLGAVLYTTDRALAQVSEVRTILV